MLSLSSILNFNLATSKYIAIQGVAGNHSLRRLDPCGTLILAKGVCIEYKLSLSTKPFNHVAPFFSHSNQLQQVLNMQPSSQTHDHL